MTHGRRAIVALFALLALTTDAEPVRADETTVRLWHAYGGAEEAALQSAVDRFEAENPTIHVVLLANAFGAYASKLESAIPTGRGPDLFIDAHERLATYLERGLLAPAGDVDTSDFDPSHVAALSDEGVVYGLPLSLKCAALYLNNELAPTEIHALTDLTAADPPGDVAPLVFEAENAYYVAAFLHAHGGQLLDENGDYAFVGAEAERTVEELRALLRSGVVPEEANGELVKRMFVNERAAAAISGPWLAPDLPDSLSWRVEPLPPLVVGGAAMAPYLTVEAGFISRTADEPELARQLLAFLAGPRGAEVRATEGRQVVASQQAWEIPALRDDAFLATFRDAAGRAVPMPTHPHMRQAFEPAQRALRKILRGGVPIADALAEGAHRFTDITRPPRPAKDPTFGMLFVGFALLGGVLLMVRRAQDPELRAAIRASIPAYKYVAHAVLAVGLLVLLPLFVGALTSFFAGHGTDMHYVGIDNYVDILSARGGDLFGHGSFWLVLLVTVVWTVLNLSLHLGIGVALALLLHRPTLKFKGIYRVVLILPWAVPSYVTALAWKGMFHRQFGAINTLLEAVGAEPVSWFAHFSTAFAANIATNVWLGFPFMMVITLGALSGIPQDLYEAAAVDGATAWQRFRRITAPLLVPSLAPAVAMGAVWTFNMFNVVFLVSGGEPDGSTEILVSEAYRWAFTRSSQYGYAAAYAVLIFLILVLTTRLGQKGLEASRPGSAT